MKPGPALALLTALSACGAPASGQAPGPIIEHIEVLLNADSGGERMIPVDRLRLPSQRPWQNGFYVAVSIGGADARLNRAQTIGVSFDIRMGPQLYDDPDREELLSSKVDEQGEWFRAGTASTKDAPCSPACSARVVFGPFELPALIPGPRQAEALLWPTRLRIHAQVLAVPRPERVRDAIPASVKKSVATREILIN